MGRARQPCPDTMRPADAEAQFQGYGLFETGRSAACSKRFIRNGASAGALLRAMSEATCSPSASILKPWFESRIPYTFGRTQSTIG